MENNKEINKTGVYKIVNKINGKVYFGSARCSFRRRWNEHKNDLNKNQHHCVHLQNDWNKYGFEVFEFNIILECSPEECLIYEQMYLDLYWDGGIMCYNISKEVYSSFAGMKHTDETKQKISKGNMGKKRRPKTEEEKEHLRKMNKGKKPWNAGKYLIEIRNKNKLFGKKSPMFGKTMSKETKEKMSEAAKKDGRKFLDNQRPNIYQRLNKKRNKQD